MDRMARNRLGNMQLENRQARAFIRYLCDLYQKNKRFRFLLLKEFIVNMGVEATFEETASIGKIPVTYGIHDNIVNVQVNLIRIERKHRKRVFILNEQSASHFRKHCDSKGTTLVDGQIGAWDNVDAEYAWFTDMQEQFGFRVWQRKK
jgi:hypothetical protein